MKQIQSVFGTDVKMLLAKIEYSRCCECCISIEETNFTSIIGNESKTKQEQNSFLVQFSLSKAWKIMVLVKDKR